MVHISDVSEELTVNSMRSPPKIKRSYRRMLPFHQARKNNSDAGVFTKVKKHKGGARERSSGETFE